MQKGDRRLTEFTVTPMIQHAVALLRAAIPAGAAEITVAIADGHLEARRTQGLSEPQLAAAFMLIGISTYHHDLMVAVYGEIDERTGKMPDALRAAHEAFRADVRRKLNIEADGYVVNGEWDGVVTIYR